MNDLDLQAQQAAYLRAKHKMSQAEIGKLLGNISQSQVSRLLSRAENQLKCLRVESKFIENGISPERMTLIKQVLEPADLKQKLKEIKTETGINVTRIWVFDSGDSEKILIDERLENFGSSAAGVLDDVLSQAKVVAISFGATLYNLISGLAALKLFSAGKHPIEFIPVGGEPVGRGISDDPLAAYTSSRLADRLREVVNNNEGERYTLSGMRAFIPKRFAPGEREVIRKYNESGGSFKKIFTDKNPAIARVDTFLTSIGMTEKPMGFCNAELLEDGRIDTDTLKSLVVSDLGGVLIPQPGIDRRALSRVAELNEMWTGIRLEHIKRIVEDASKAEGRRGVVVAAIGKRKAAPLYHIIKAGLINELIIDQDLASSLISLLEQDSH